MSAQMLGNPEATVWAYHTPAHAKGLPCLALGPGTSRLHGNESSASTFLTTQPQPQSMQSVSPPGRGEAQARTQGPSSGHLTPIRTEDGKSSSVCLRLPRVFVPIHYSSPEVQVRSLL